MNLNNTMEMFYKNVIIGWGVNDDSKLMMAAAALIYEQNMRHVHRGSTKARRANFKRNQKKVH
jgi:hypothetical protein